MLAFIIQTHIGLDTTQTKLQIVLNILSAPSKVWDINFFLGKLVRLSIDFHQKNNVVMNKLGWVSESMKQSLIKE